MTATVAGVLCGAHAIVLLLMVWQSRRSDRWRR